jgi:hypothetical protein
VRDNDKQNLGSELYHQNFATDTTLISTGTHRPTIFKITKLLSHSSAMALPSVRPQKRKNDDFTTYAPASKKPRKPMVTSRYQRPIQPNNYYPAISAPYYPTIPAKYTHLQTSRHQPPNPQFPYFCHDESANTAFKDAIIANAWLQEWQTAPKDFEPSRPLSLLNEPLSIDMATYPRKTSQVYLNHWDRDHEPNGTTSQRLAREDMRSKKLEQDQVFESIKQEAERSKVKQAAKNAEVIDLTEDDRVENEAPWRRPAFENAENYPLRYRSQDQKILDALSRQDSLFAQLSMNPSVYGGDHTRPHSRVAFGTSHH